MEEKSKRRTEYEATRSGTLLTYVAQKGDAFGKRVNLLSQLIHGNHEPSLGGYKERLLADAIRQSIPNRYEVATGFVAFPTLKNKNDETASHEISRQLDIIIYDGSEYAPIFRDNEFVIVPPRSVRAIIEVKSTASYDSVNDTVAWAIDFAEKWSRCSETYREMAHKPPPPPALISMFWDIYVPPKGKPEITPENLSTRIRDIYTKLVQPPIRKTFPILDPVAIYGKMLVRPTTYVEDKEEGMAWYTYRGQFVEKVNEEYRELGDRTIGDIIAAVLVRLRTPFDTFFAYVDNEHSMEALEFPGGVHANWLQGGQYEFSLIKDDDFE